METTVCEVCGNSNLISALDLGTHPLCDDLVAIGETRVCKEYPINLLLCSTCVTVFQRVQVPKTELFPPSYHYRARFTADVLAGMQQMVAECEKIEGDLSGKLVVDIGCNDGSLLDFFKAKGCKTVGVEPTDASIDAREKGHSIYANYFTADIADLIVAEHGRPDIITFTNVFAHIENLPALLGALKNMLSEDTLIAIENHYLGSVLDRYQFDTFYHEHPRTYSLTSFVHIARTLGMKLLNVEFPSRYGGNIRIFIGSEKRGMMTPQIDATLDKEKLFGARLLSFQDKIDRWKIGSRAQFQALVEKFGKLPAKAFPARVAILVHLLGFDTETIAAVYERPGSKKIGHYVPGTRIPIRSEEELFAGAANAPVVVNFAWHIHNEIWDYLRKHGITGEIVDIFDPDKFHPA